MHTACFCRYLTPIREALRAMVNAHNHHRIRTDRRHRATHAAYGSVYRTGVPFQLWGSAAHRGVRAPQLMAVQGCQLTNRCTCANLFMYTYTQQIARAVLFA